MFLEVDWFVPELIATFRKYPDIGLLSFIREAFCPIEWDEADLAYRIRKRGGWKVATYNYERLGTFTHLGSSTLWKMPNDKHKAMVLPDGKLFHQRRQDTIRSQHPRKRLTWWRAGVDSLPQFLTQAADFGWRKVRRNLPASWTPSP